MPEEANYGVVFFTAAANLAAAAETFGFQKLGIDLRT
jgi:hypothetical protein